MPGGTKPEGYAAGLQPQLSQYHSNSQLRKQPLPQIQTQQLQLLQPQSKQSLRVIQGDALFETAYYRSMDAIENLKIKVQMKKIADRHFPLNAMSNSK